MKNSETLTIEVQRIESLAARVRAEFRRNEAAVRTRAAAIARDPFASTLEESAQRSRDCLVHSLMTLPLVTVRAMDGYAEQVHRLRRYRVVRDIQVELTTAPLVYRLSEERFEVQDDERLLSVFGPHVVVTSENLSDVLQAGYDDIAEDEMLEKLWPIIETVESRENGEPTGEEIAAVESILGLPSMSSVDRLRMRDEISGFLEGRVEAGEFISRAVQNNLSPPALYEGTRESLRLTQAMDEP